MGSEIREAVTPEDGRLPVSVESVKEFSRSLLKSGAPAWQRLQAVRAVDAYRDLILRTEEPSLAEIRQALQRLAARERDEAATGAAGASEPEIRSFLTQPFTGLWRLMFLVMYGMGLRHRECRRSWIRWMTKETCRECVGRKSRATGV